MVYTEAVEDCFQHLMAQDPGGCHAVQICQVVLKEIDQWKAKASAPPAPHPLPRRVRSKLRLTPVPGLRLSGVTRPRPAKAGPRARRGSDGPGDALESKPRPATAGSGPQHTADGPGDAQASEPQPATAGSRPQSPSDKLTDVPLPNESTPPGVQAQRSQIPGLRQKRVRPSRGPGDALESKPRPATAGSRPPRAADGSGDAQASEPPPAAAGSGPQSSADGLGEATLAPGVGGLASRPHEFAQPGGPAQRSQIPGRRPKRVQQSRAGGNRSSSGPGPEDQPRPPRRG